MADPVLTSRRTALGLLAAVGAASGSAHAAATVKPPVVLVHGAWHGGWCWAEVADILRAAGHRVFTPTLTGLGARKHLMSPTVTLDTHATDIVNLLTYEDLSGVMLVGHSYAGMVITLVADRAAARLGRLVYLDAGVRDAGEPFLHDTPPDRIATMQAEAIEGYLLPPLPPSVLGIASLDEAKRVWVKERLTLHPLATLLAPLILDNPVGAGLPRHFIHCTEGPLAKGFGKDFDRAEAMGFVSLHRLSTGHDAMLSDPAGTAALLLRITEA